jgi:hypothetical protein
LGLTNGIFNLLRIKKSVMEEEAAQLDLLLARAVEEIIHAIADLQLVALLLNLAYQMAFRELIIAALIVRLHCGDRALSQSFQISSIL